MNRKVDPSTMKTDAVRELAARVNRSIETSDTQLHRATQVLNEYFCYTHDFQLDLADAAIVWAFSALASHARKSECKSNFHALADIMYVSTDDATNTFSESDRQQIAVAASAVAEHLCAGIGDILRESVQLLSAYETGNVLRTTAEMLHQSRGMYLEHAPPQLLCNLIGHCFIMCQAFEAHELGIDSATELQTAVKNVVDACSQTSSAVIDAVKAGRLVVQNGVIVNPQPT